MILELFLVSSLTGLLIYIYDIFYNTQPISSLMKLVWGLSILYSGLLGLGIYWYSGRNEIARDSLYRRGFRSTAHCYSGCGLGEIVGVILATVFFSGTSLYVATFSFSLAYVFGFALTIGPLIQEGIQFKNAFFDALTTETASITVMEIVAIGVDIVIVSTLSLTILDPLFWVALFVSLSFGFIAAFPVNTILIRLGVKEGMMNPKQMN